jgi:hypothetical protein
VFGPQQELELVSLCMHIFEGVNVVHVAMYPHSDACGHVWIFVAFLKLDDYD